jgi:hypothetical protein
MLGEPKKQFSLTRAALSTCGAKKQFLISLIATLAVASGRSTPAAAAPHPSPYAAWKHGPSADPGFFPLAVWRQTAEKAKDYQAIGINTYMGLWYGPTEQQLAALKQAGMRVIYDADAPGWQQHQDDPIICGRMRGDEPDNAQAEEGGGYGPAIPPQAIVDTYARLRRQDPTRPVLLNLGQQVANDEWSGRGCEITAYPEYVQGADIISFDVYPVVNLHRPDGENYLWYVAKGLDRLRQWTGGKKIIWNTLECSRYNDKRATPHEVRAEAWMSIVHGSQGIMWFAFIEDGVLADPEMREAVKGVNEQITALARVLNSPTLENGAVVTSTNPLVPVDLLVKQFGGATYVFAVGMRNAETSGRFRLPGLENGTAEVLGERRTIAVQGREFQDTFAPYDVHIYKIVGSK